MKRKSIRVPSAAQKVEYPERLRKPIVLTKPERFPYYAVGPELIRRPLSKWDTR